ncbi:WG repeat-containing protein [Dawidia soli]|uniref:WG repeat-containing protein n=1 Tax=Dawidia soli TaxID=2782352 RepID=A0AAP2GDP8_9BACT|nr:WG repeat-containing protein [Dawidia soli]MBT1687559.1 WG repeat-containing protein [Dawidia soli]
MRIVSRLLYCCLLIFFLSEAAYAGMAEELSVFEENGKVGLKDDHGKVLIPAKYDARGWSDGRFSVIDQAIGYKLNGRWGLISISNHILTKNEYEEILPGDGSVLIARKQVQPNALRVATGCLNTSGKEIISFQYDGVKLASLRAIVFGKSGNTYKYGLLSLDNRTIIPQQYQSIYPIGSLRFAVENFDDKIAIFTETGRQLTGFTIDRIAPFTKRYATLYQNGMQGVIDRDGQIKVQPRYRGIAILEDGTIKAREADEWQFLNGQNKLTQKVQADALYPVATNRLKVMQGGVLQLTDLSLKPLSPQPYTTIGEFENGKALVSVQGKYGVIDLSGRTLIQPAHDSLVLLFTHHRALAGQRQGGKYSWTLIDTTGTRRSSKSYDNIDRFDGTYFVVRARGYAGTMDLAGREVVPCTYDSVLQTKDNLLVVKFRGQYGIINQREEWIVTPRLSKLFLLGHDRYIEQTTRTRFLKSLDGNVIYFTENPLTYYPDYILELLPSGTLWKIDMNGRIADRRVFPSESLEKIYEESEGLRAIRKNGKYGFIDNLGRLRIANRYEGVKQFSEGLAPAMIRGHWGFINHDDQIAIQPVYDEVSGFQNGFALVKQKGLTGIVDKTGRLLLPARYEDITVLPTRNLLIRSNGLVGLAGNTGKILIQPKYQHLEDTGKGFAIVERDGIYGVITLQGISTVPMVYDTIVYDPFNNVFLALKKSPWQNLTVN